MNSVANRQTGRARLSQFTKIKLLPLTLIIFVVSGLIMLAYESIQHELLGYSLSMWGSHLVTIFFTATLSTMTGVLVHAWADNLEDEILMVGMAFDAHHGVVITDAHQKILKVNKAFTKITGYTSDEVVGKTPKLLSSGRHDAKFYSQMWNSLNKCGFWQGEIWNRRKNGDVYPEFLNITKIMGTAESATHYVATLTDITAIKNTEQSLREVSKLTRAGSFQLNIGTNRLDSSEMLDEILGIDANYHRTGDEWTTCIFPDDRDEMLAYCQQTFAQKSRFDRVYRIVRFNDGAVRSVHGLADVVCNAQGEPTQLIGVIREITERKKVA